jgi:hypothetical protein
MLIKDADFASDRTCATLFDAFLAETSDAVPCFDRLLVLADACDDARDDTAAACLRWAADNRKRPRWSGGERRAPAAQPQWYGVEKQSGMYVGLDPESDLPVTLYRHLPAGEYEHDKHRKDYATTRAAWFALAAGWRAAVASGWVPHAFTPAAVKP